MQRSIQLHLVGGSLDRPAQLVALGILEYLADGARPHRAHHRGIL